MELHAPRRAYMAGLGCFLTAARLAEQLIGEHPYGYALNNPVTYADPSGLSPGGDLVTCINAWVALGYSPSSACNYCKAAQGYTGCYNCNSLSNVGVPVVPGQPTRGYGVPIIDPTVIFAGISGGFPNLNQAVCEGTCDTSVRRTISVVVTKIVDKACVAACNALRQGGCKLLFERCLRMGDTYMGDDCMIFYNTICTGE